PSAAARAHWQSAPRFAYAPHQMQSNGRPLVLVVGLACAVLIPPAEAGQPRYAAVKEGDVVKLSDRTTDTVISILPSLGNMAFEMKVHGQNVLRYPHSTIEEFRKAPNTIGIPFMGPWINRLDEQAFWANGKRYPFDMTLGNVRGAIPIHGFLTLTDKWKIVEARADKSSAWVTSRLE